MTLTPKKPLRSVIFGLSLVVHFVSVVSAQVGPAPAMPKATTPAAQLVEVGPMWADLGPDQKIALAPLTSTWPALSAGQKGKWIALVRKYPQMSEADKSRLSDRMVDWAALSPKDRERARLNFAETKKLDIDSRVANWESYQALPESKKQALLDAAPKKPAGAAVAVKPVAANKLAAVPVTRKTPEPLRAIASQSAAVDRYTLLRQNPATKEIIQAPAPAIK
jgi:hypothetical protein